MDTKTFRKYIRLAVAVVLQKRIHSFLLTRCSSSCEMNALRFQGRFKAVGGDLTSSANLNGHKGTVNLSSLNGYRNLTSRLSDE